ncbi:protein FAM114A2 [Diachasma alloeum]|uniref:protein FAM114A2 n=1 Tax=Diachasma alloeum TaxID=454923 RepID=UPI0007383ECF|nr:protein FAM114A2 [Diachasma alloeum]
MATSDSDDFESADEEIEFRDAPRPSRPQRTPKRFNSVVDSDSDDDECGSGSENKSWASNISTGSRRAGTAVPGGKNLSEELRESEESNSSKKSSEKGLNPSQNSKSNESTLSAREKTSLTSDRTDKTDDISEKKSDSTPAPAKKQSINEGKVELSVEKENEDVIPSSRRHQRPEKQRKEKPSKPVGLGAKKLGVKIPEERPRPPPEDIFTPEDIRRRAIEAGKEPPMIQECWEVDDDEATKILQNESQSRSSWVTKGKDSPEFDDVPEELKSNKSFKEVFQGTVGGVGDGWETFGDEEVSKVEGKAEAKAVLDKLAEKQEEAGGWGGWGSWGSSLLTTASVGVSTLTSHVSQGLSMLEESMGVPDPEELVGSAEAVEAKEEKPSTPEEPQSQIGFGLGSWMSGVSSITKLVESTGTKVITGGLGTLETIGKKTMEVLQEGDPGLKKKRAFFKNEVKKPILSQILREAKEKAESGENTVENSQMTKTFEILFDDAQGLVHLEALEMLSKQISMKIEHKLVTLEADEMMSVQETLEEVKELCDLGEEDEDDKEGDSEETIKSACADLGVSIHYGELKEIWEETKIYLTEVSSPESTVTDKEVFQNAISTLARLTAYSVERFHKTAELLLVKERRSTVNEADALVQLTKILSGQIGTAASSFSKCLNARNKNGEGKPKESDDITTIFLEATNASSYIQDAFRLLIPILQVGAL